MTAKPTKPKRMRGVLCPDCAVPMRQLKTRRAVNIIVRRRVCPSCGRRLTTQERPVGGL